MNILDFDINSMYAYVFPETFWPKRLVNGIKQALNLTKVNPLQVKSAGLNEEWYAPYLIELDFNAAVSEMSYYASAAMWHNFKNKTS